MFIMPVSLVDGRIKKLKLSNNYKKQKIFHRVLEEIAHGIIIFIVHRVGVEPTGP